ncbi:MAG: MFS transporter [Coriobacteriales bacterium]|jgi:MFS family permease|nr:MFS transporter [Coriobacteriales bacterium]
MSDAKEVSYGFGVKVAVLMLIIVQYTMTMTTQITTNIMNYSLSLGEQFGYLYNQTDAIVYSLALVSGLATTFLLKKFSKKTVAVSGAVIMGFFGFLPFFTGPIGYLGVLIPRACVGLGVGIIFPFAASYAVDLFKGGKESWMLGMRSVVGACAGFFFMNASAFIANLYYPMDANGVYPFPTGAFVLPLIAFICAIIMIIKLPNEGIIYAQEQLSEEERNPKKPATSSLIYITVAVLMLGVLLAIIYFVYNAITNNPPLSIPDAGIANPLSYAIAVVFLLFAILFIITMFKTTGVKVGTEGIGTKIKSNTWIFILANVLIIGAGNCMMSNVAQVVGGPVIAGVAAPFTPESAAIEDVVKNLTDWSGVLAGTAEGPAVNIGNVMNAFTIAMLVSGFIFKPVWVGIFKRHAYTMGITMCGVGLVLLYVSVCMMGSLPFALVAAVIFGLGFQTYNGAVILRIAQSNDNKHVALSTSYLMAFNGVGQTFGPVWIPGLIMIVLGMSFDNFFLFSNSWLFAGILLIVMAIIMGIYTTQEKVYRPEAAF